MWNLLQEGKQDREPTVAFRILAFCPANYESAPACRAPWWSCPSSACRKEAPSTILKTEELLAAVENSS